MTVREMLLNYVKETGDLLTALAIAVTIDRTAETWTEADTEKYGTELKRAIFDLTKRMK
jgi:hypothetical protein